MPSKRDLLILLLGAVFVFLFLAGLASAQQTPPKNWHVHVFAAPPDEIYAAARQVLRTRHDIDRSEPNDPSSRFLRFRVGTTAWSWGYRMTLILRENQAGGTDAEMHVERKGGVVASWGSGSKETKKIWKWIEEELESRRRNAATKFPAQF